MPIQTRGRAAGISLLSIFLLQAGFAWAQPRPALQVAAADQQPAPKTPSASLKCMQVRPGFEVTLVAAEPLVQDPIAFAFAADGRLWVVEMGDYPLGAGDDKQPGGRIKILEDLDGDGVYDKATVFLDHLPFPTGVTPWRNGVLITAAPNILYAEDTDHDGKADKTAVLFTGFVEGNQQHRVNGLVMGLDNWFYGANGHSNGAITSLKTGKRVDIRNRDFRLRPDTGEFEAATGVTQYGRNRDDVDNWFGNDNSHPLFHFTLEEHYLRRNPYLTMGASRLEVPETPGPSPVFPISRTLTRFNDFAMANHFTSANSSIVYRDDLFGEGFVGNVFISEPVHNLVSRQVMRPDGLTFRSTRASDEQEREFLASSDNWFRPTMIRIGPDGALYVADMYRLVIEHPQWIPQEWQQKLDLRAGHDMGRIYRIAPVGVARRKPARLDTMTQAALVASLASPSGWQRDMAQQLLIERNDPAAVPMLQEMARSNALPLARLHALCTLDGIGGLKESILLTALADRDASVRRHAVRLCEPRLNNAPAIAREVAHLAADPDLHVRLQVACSLGEWSDPAAGIAIARILVDNPDQPILQTAALSSLKPGNLTPTLAAIGSPGAGGRPSATLVGALARMMAAGQDIPATAALLDALSLPRNGGYETWQFEALSAANDAMQGRDAYLAHADAMGPSLERMQTMIDAARGVAIDRKEDEHRRVAATALLGALGHRWKEDQSAIASLLTPGTATEIQVAAIGAVARARRDDGPVVLLAGWRGFTPRLRGVVLDTLLARSAWAGGLLDAIENGTAKPADIDAARRQALALDKTPEIRDRARKLLAAAINPDRQKVIDAMKPATTLPGDAVHGRELFTRTCAACHRAADIGNAVGPDLTGVGDKSPDGLLVAILDPNRAVEPRFISYVIETRAGDTLSGLLASESGNAITLLGPDGKSTQLLRADIVSLRSTGLSLMPEGLEAGWKAQDLADVVAFVRAMPAGRK